MSNDIKEAIKTLKNNPEMKSAVADELNDVIRGDDGTFHLHKMKPLKRGQITRDLIYSCQIDEEGNEIED